MAPPSGVKRPRYGTRQLIEQVFRDSGSATGLKTSELVSRVQSASGAGSKVPGPTIFQAARALVRGKVLEAERDGREFRFRLATPSGSSASEGPAEGPRAPSRSVATGQASSTVEPLRMEEVTVSASLPVSSLPHRLDPGQMLVLKHDEKEIVTLTNVHGKAVIERHPI